MGEALSVAIAIFGAVIFLYFLAWIFRSLVQTATLREKSKNKPDNTKNTNKKDADNMEKSLDHADLLNKIRRMREAGKEIIRQRDTARDECIRLLNENHELKNKLEQINLVNHERAADDTKFHALKREFAILYHPDRQRSDGLERVIRSEIFKEFWAKIENIERGR